MAAPARQQQHHHVEVEVPGLGVARGSTERGRTNVFKGLPFATARRFEPAVAVTSWHGGDGSGTFDATQEQLAAWQSGQPQPQVHQTEECLTMTVRTPVGAPGLPVMCWIHGGNHQDGRAEQPHEPQANALPEKGVVLVKIQYRLGVFGYFAHPELPDTNFGTSDQVVALEFIREHIASFGGDPGNVTIFGVSAVSESRCC
jgi:para-nitrobenzyl esterase